MKNATTAKKMLRRARAYPDAAHLFCSCWVFETFYGSEVARDN